MSNITFKICAAMLVLTPAIAAPIKAPASIVLSPNQHHIFVLPKIHETRSEIIKKYTEEKQKQDNSLFELWNNNQETLP